MLKIRSCIWLPGPAGSAALSERSVAWLARLFRVQEVVSSNLTAPTISFMIPEELKLAKYSIGVGDRFAQQARAQLRACMQAAAQGVEVIPVWNKSHREHLIVGSEPASTRAAAAAAVKELGWDRPWHVDADHIRLETVD